MCRQKFSCVKTVKLSIITYINHSSRWYICLIIFKVISNKPAGRIGISYWDPDCIFTHSLQQIPCVQLFRSFLILTKYTFRHTFDKTLFRRGCVKKSGSGLSKIWWCTSLRSNLRYKLLFVNDDFRHNDNWDYITP